MLFRGRVSKVIEADDLLARYSAARPRFVTSCVFRRGDRRGNRRSNNRRRNRRGNRRDIWSEKVIASR